MKTTCSKHDYSGPHVSCPECDLERTTIREMERRDRDDAKGFDAAAEWRARAEKAEAAAAVMRARLVLSWPDSGDADAPTEAGSTCYACDACSYDNPNAKTGGPEDVVHDRSCVVLSDVGVSVLAELRRLGDLAAERRNVLIAIHPPTSCSTAAGECNICRAIGVGRAPLDAPNP